MNRFHKYLTSLGFTGVADAKQKNDARQIRAFAYEQFDPKAVRQTLGRAKAHRPGLFVFVLKRDRAIRVDSERCLILLGNGKDAVQALLRTIDKD